MLTFAFWNLMRRAKPDKVAALAHESDADVLALAECAIPVGELLAALNHNQENPYFPDRFIFMRRRVLIFTRFTDQFVKAVADHPDTTIREITLPLGDKILLVATHLASKLWTKTEDQVQGCCTLATHIREAENQVEHKRTVLLGDFNMNPFEAGMVGSEGLHAISDRRIAAKDSRNVNGELRTFFYNPMWSFFGDQRAKTPGTYFYNSRTQVNYYWNVFDQVMVRPPLIKHVHDDSVQVVTELNGESLLNRSKQPNKRLHSDHLPIILRLLAVER